MTQRPDVAIVGGGIIGASAAAHLAAAGARVALFEQGADVAAAASGRNAGLILRPPDPVMATLYDESVALYRELAGTPIGDGRAFGLPTDPIAMLGLSADEDLMRRLATSFATDLIDRQGLRELEPLVAPDLVAVTISSGFAARPADATRAHAWLARMRRADIRVGAAARPWVQNGRALGVEVGGARVAAGTVLIAAGWWTRDLVDGAGALARLPVFPVWGVLVEMAMPEPPRHVLEEVTAEDSMNLAAHGEAPLFTLNPAPLLADGRPSANPAIGNTLAPVEPDPAALAPVLVQHARRFLPSLRDDQTRSVRACPRPGSPDGRPFVGFVEGVAGLVVAAGNGPWGISTGPATGRVAARAVMDGDDRSVPPELRASRARGDTSIG